jgi:YgiT-type zinc finger domain-containing protein
MSNQCAFCKGKLEEKRITYPTEYKGRVIIVTNVPALVCTQCGETLLEPTVAEKLQKIVWGEVPNHKTVAVDTYDFAEVA